MKLKRQIPNIITSFNLLSGCLAIVAAFNQQLTWAALLIGIAAIFDFLDGLVARLLKVHSEIGKQLDSLADVVSFGLVPGIIMFQLITVANGDFFVPLLERNAMNVALSLTAFIIPVLSAFRLAKFNIDTRQSDSFIGVPTPANAIFIGSLVLIMDMQLGLNIYSPASDAVLKTLLEQNLYHPYEIQIASAIYNPYFLAFASITMSILLVSEIPLFALKFKTLRWNENKIRFIFLLISAGLFLYYEVIALPIIIILYILLSIINNFATKRKNH